MDRVEFQPLTDEEMSAQGLSDLDTWMIKHGDEVYGPYEANSLRQHALQHEAFFATLEASIVAEEKWTPFFEAGPFRKRTPKLVSTATLARPERYWVILKGQRHGPHTHAEVQALVDDHQLQATDLVSGDEAQSWQQVIELPYFTQIRHDSGKLPQAPQFADEEAVPHYAPAEQVRDGLASLAYLGKPKADGFSLDEVKLPESRPVEIAKPERIPLASRKHTKVARYAAVAVAVVVGVITLWPSSKVEDFDSVADADAPANVNDIELMPAGSSLLDADTPTPPRARRFPASNQANSVPSPRAMNGARRNLARMQESHQDYNEAPAEVEAPEVGLYPEEAPNDAGAEAQRTPSSEPEANADDGYRMEEDPADKAAEAAPVVEEVGDF